MKRFLTATTLVLAATLGATGNAATSYSNLVHVSHCEASENITTFAGSTWAPGYYPYAGRPYYWNNVYGYRYSEPPVTTSNPELAIHFKNVAPQTMKEIEFGLVANGNLVAEVKDVGTFSPGIDIKHKFGISQNVFPLQTSLAQCVPLKILFESGNTWVNPHLPRLKHRNQY